MPIRKKHILLRFTISNILIILSHYILSFTRAQPGRKYFCIPIIKNLNYIFSLVTTYK